MATKVEDLRYLILNVPSRQVEAEGAYVRRGKELTADDLRWIIQHCHRLNRIRAEEEYTHRRATLPVEDLRWLMENCPGLPKIEAEVEYSLRRRSLPVGDLRYLILNGGRQTRVEAGVEYASRDGLTADDLAWLAEHASPRVHSLATARLAITN